MAHTASRQTLYFLLSAVEEDLRALIIRHMSGESPESVLTADVLNEAEKLRLDAEGARNEPASLAGIMPYTNFGDLHKTINRHRREFGRTGDEIRALTSHFEKAVAIRNRVAHIRPLEFDDLPFVRDFLSRLLAIEEAAWPATVEALNVLKENPSFVLGVDLPVVQDAREQSHNLPVPDFDETGFIGREALVQDVVGRVLGPYPVITIVGEGGIGKTALALKAAYELLERGEEFEAIVWASSKTTQLTGNDVVRIQHAISDSLGLFSAISERLAGSVSEDPLKEVLDYLASFRILLIIDNLETVLDDRIRNFLSSLPPSSKVLITSRIGLGAFEYPIKLGPMEDSDAIRLLRAVAEVRGVPEIGRTENAILRDFCRKMNNNPGYIKWFVSAVQAGQRPESVIAAPGPFLEFCMSNVYEHLSSEPKKLLRCMLCVPGDHSQAELAFLSDTDALQLQGALQQLMSTNMVEMTSTPRGSTYVSNYNLSDLARAYLSRAHPVRRAEHQDFLKRKRQLAAAEQAAAATEQAYPYDIHALVVRDRSDRVVVKYLRDALESVRARQYDEAARVLDEAKRLSPHFFEVRRVEGWLEAERGNVSAALTAYEAAVELEPNHAPLRLWFGQFLLRELDDIEGAWDQLQAAEKIDPDSFVVQLEIARNRMWAGDFTACRQRLDALFGIGSLSEWDQKRLYDLDLQFYARKADSLVQAHQPLAAFEQLKLLKQRYDTIPSVMRDGRMRYKLGKAAPTARRCIREGSPETYALADWLERESQLFDEELGLQIGDLALGRISRLPVTENFGFVALPNGAELFFHRHALISSAEWDLLRIGVGVRFRVLREGASFRAVEVEMLNPAEGGLAIGEQSEGVIDEVAEGFVFVRSVAGPRIYANRKAFPDSTTSVALAVGDPVHFIVGPHPRAASGKKVSSGIRLSNLGVSQPVPVDVPRRGSVHSLVQGRDYFFILDPSGHSIFCSRTALTSAGHWLLVKQGAVVEYVIRAQAKGLVATRVRVVRDANTSR